MILEQPVTLFILISGEKMKNINKFFDYILSGLAYIAAIISLTYPISSALPLIGFFDVLNWKDNFVFPIACILGFATGLITWWRRKWFFPYLVNSFCWITFILSLLISNQSTTRSFSILLLISSVQFTSYTWIMPVATKNEEIKFTEIITKNSNMPLKDNPRFYAIIAGVLMIIVSIVLLFMLNK